MCIRDRVLVPYARHGRGLALYGLKRYPKARDTWAGLLNQSAPRAVAWEGTFWLGDTLGRLGDSAGADRQRPPPSGLVEPRGGPAARRGQGVPRHAVGVSPLEGGAVGARGAGAGPPRPRRLHGSARGGQEARAGRPQRPP